MGEQAAFVHLPRTGPARDADWLWRLECHIRRCLESSGAGQLDGVETSDGEWIAFTYGPCADQLVRVLQDALTGRTLPGRTLPARSFIASRRGGLETTEERHQLGRAGPSGLGRVVPIRPSDVLAALAIKSAEGHPGHVVDRP